MKRLVLVVVVLAVLAAGGFAALHYGVGAARAAAAAAVWERIKARLADRVTVAEGAVEGGEDTLTVHDLVLTPKAGGQPLKIGRMELKGRQEGDKPVVQRLSLQAMTQEGSAADNRASVAGLTVEDPSPVLVDKLLARQFDAIAPQDLDCGSLRIDGIDGTAPKRSVSVDSVSAQGMQDGRLDTLSVQGVRLTAKDGDTDTAVALDGAELQDVAAPGLIALLGPQGTGNAAASPLMLQPRQAKLRGLVASRGGAEALRIASFDETMRFDNNGRLPAEADATLSGLVLTDNDSLSPELRAYFASKKLTALSGNARLVYKLNQVTGTLQLDRLSLDMPDALRLTASGKLGGIPDPQTLADPRGNAMAMLALTLHNLDVTLEDRGLVAFILARVADKQGLSQEEAAAKLLAAPVLKADDMVPVRDALADFMAHGGTLHVVSAPQSPVPVLGLLMNAKNLVQRLGLSVTASR